LKALDALADYMGMSRSVAIRELIPPSAITIAAAEKLKLEEHEWAEKLKSQNLEDSEGLFKRNTRLIILDMVITYVGRLAEQMINDSKHPIGLQYELLCGGEDPHIKTALLYAKWSRAKRGMSGYKFEQILYRGKARFTIVIGPGDTDEAIEVLKKRVLEYATKLGLKD
jgi:hypothetical protein